MGEVTFPARDFECSNRPRRETCSLDRPLRSEEARTVEVSREYEGETFVYLLDRISWPADGRVGFDLDGLDSSASSASGDCERFAIDYPNALDPAVSGVDNQMAGFVQLVQQGVLDSSDCPRGRTGCSDQLFTRDVQDGRLLLLLEVRGVDSFIHDPEVEVAIFRGSSAGLIDFETGRAEPGQRFRTEEMLAPPVRGRTSQAERFAAIEAGEARLRRELAAMGAICAHVHVASAALEHPVLESFAPHECPPGVRGDRVVPADGVSIGPFRVGRGVYASRDDPTWRPGIAVQRAFAIGDARVSMEFYFFIDDGTR